MPPIGSKAFSIRARRLVPDVPLTTETRKDGGIGVGVSVGVAVRVGVDVGVRVGVGLVGGGFVAS